MSVHSRLEKASSSLIRTARRRAERQALKAQGMGAPALGAMTPDQIYKTDIADTARLHASLIQPGPIPLGASPPLTPSRGAAALGSESVANPGVRATVSNLAEQLKYAGGAAAELGNEVLDSPVTADIFSKMKSLGSKGLSLASAAKTPLVGGLGGLAGLGVGLGAGLSGSRNGA